MCSCISSTIFLVPVLIFCFFFQCQIYSDYDPFKEHFASSRPKLSYQDINELVRLDYPIRILQSNPIRGGAGYARYERYKGTTSINAMLAAGGTRADINNCVQKGYITLGNDAEQTNAPAPAPVPAPVPVPARVPAPVPARACPAHEHAAGLAAAYSLAARPGGDPAAAVAAFLKLQAADAGPKHGCS